MKHWHACGSAADAAGLRIQLTGRPWALTVPLQTAHAVTGDLGAFRSVCCHKGWPGWHAWHPSPNMHNTNTIKNTEKPDPQPTPSATAAAGGNYQPPRAWPAAAAAAAPAAALTGDACWLRLPPRRQQFEGGSA